jgi:uncharacterized protein (TIGR02145 family)
MLSTHYYHFVILNVCIVAHLLSVASLAQPTAVGQSQEQVKDFDGNLYHTVKIGTQVWMAENLRVTHYRDGTPIPNVTNSAKWSELMKGAYCWYENNAMKFRAAYGALYNYYAVADPRTISPVGWHIPSDSEWAILELSLGGADEAGDSLKVLFSDFWNGTDTEKPNATRLSGVLGGGRARLGWFGEKAKHGTWWSSTEIDGSYAWHRGLSYGSASISRNAGHKASGFSVRCVRDR